MLHSDQEAVKARSQPGISLGDLGEIGPLGGIDAGQHAAGISVSGGGAVCSSRRHRRERSAGAGGAGRFSGVVDRRVLLVTVGVMQYPRAEIGNGERPVVKKLFLHAQVPVLRVSLLQVRGQHKIGSRGREKRVGGCGRK